MEKKPVWGSVCVVLSSILWGTALLYTQYVLDHGIKPKDLVSLKMFFGFLTLFLYLLLTDRNLLKTDHTCLKYSALMGFVCHALYNLFMFSAIEKTTIATTVTLLYTSPIFVMIISRVLFKEYITKTKLLALIFCIVGVYLTVTGGSVQELDFDKIGIIYGLAAGMAYGTMNIISKALVQNYNQLTILTYTLGFAFLFSLSFSDPLVIFQVDFNILVYLFVIMLGVLSTAVSYLFFIKGLSLGLESSKASIISTLEVPISVIGSYLVFNQRVTLWESLGIILVISSVMIMTQSAVRYNRAGKRGYSIRT